MKTKLFLATFTCLGILTVVAAQTQKNPPQTTQPPAPVASDASKSSPVAKGKPTVIKVKPEPSKLVQALDSNRDGKISVAEIEAAVSILKGLDQDGDGELTSDEFGPVVAVEQPTTRAIVRPASPKKPSAVKQPNRPSRRPTARPNSSRTNPSRAATSKQPSSRLRRPTGRPRPSGRSGRPVTKKASALKDTSDQAPSDTLSSDRSNNSRVVSASSARRKAKTKSRRNPTALVNSTPIASPKPPKRASAEGASTREELIALQEEAKQLLEGLKQSVKTIKDRDKKQKVLQWIRRDYRQLSNSLSSGMRSDDIEANKLLIEETKQKLTEAKQLHDQSASS